MGSEIKPNSRWFLFWITPIIASVIIATIPFMVPVLTFPSISTSLHVDSHDNHIATLRVRNSGNAPATNVLLTFRAPSQIVINSVFSTENYTLIKDDDSVLRLSIPRLSNGNGSLISIDVNVSNLTDISEKQYIAYLTHDKGSLMIDSPSTSLKTSVKKDVTILEVYSIIAFSGLIGLIASQFFRIAYVMHRNRNKWSGARPRWIVSLIVGLCFVAIDVVFVLLSTNILNFDIE